MLFQSLQTNLVDHMPNTNVGNCFGLRLAGSLLALGILGSACTPIKNVRGYVPEPNLVQAVRAGVDNKSSVQAMLGSPSVVSTFEDNNWYYISKRTEKVAFFDDRITEQSIMAVHFDDKGYVTAINNLGLEDAKQINTVGKKTPTRGRELGFFEQIFGNIGRFNNAGAAPPGQ